MEHQKLKAYESDDEEFTDDKKKHRQWCVCVLNYTSEQYDAIIERAKQGKYKYIVVGKEICPTTGTPHIHIYLELKSSRSFNSIRKEFWKSNTKPRYKNSTPAQAANYCKKDGDWWEHGTISQQGKRNDIMIAKDLIQSGGTMRELFDVTTSYQALKYAELANKYLEPSRKKKTKVIWIYGPSGVGKTHYCLNQHHDKDVWISGETLRWFDGYDRHKYVIFDDFRKDFCKFHTLLRYMDKAKIKVEVKGGSREFVPEILYITTPYPPIVTGKQEKIYIS